MNFMNLLNKPLPSAVYTEGTDMDALMADLEYGGQVTEGKGCTTCESDDEEDLDSIDLSGLSDEELDAMAGELEDSDIDDVDMADDEPVNLTPEEEMEADDLMSLAGTTELLRSEMNAQERAEFFESTADTQIAIFEGLMLESDVINAQAESVDIMTEAPMFSQKNVVRMTKDARKAQLYAVALNVCARSHNDPDFAKLQKVMKLRRVLKRRIAKKYHAEAIKRMKVYFNRLRSSKSNILSNLGKKISGK